MSNRDFNQLAVLMDHGPFESDPTSSDRARVTTSLQQCLEFAATMTPEARRGIHIVLDTGDTIDAAEIEQLIAENGL